jgi:hypothetical protein
MKTLHLSIAITAGVSASVIIILGMIILLQPVSKVGDYEYVLHEPYEGVDRFVGTVTIQNQTYHVTNLNMTTFGSKPFRMEWYNVNFSFPQGLEPQNTPGGQIFEAYVTFPDNTVPYRLAGGLGPSPQSPNYNFTTVLSTHTNPQAGFTIHNGMLQLLVNWSKIHSELNVFGMHDTYTPGQPIDFQIRATGFDYFNAGGAPHINITRSDGTLLWQNPPYLAMCCPPELTDYNETFDPVRLLVKEPIILNETGLYKIAVRYSYQTVEKDFAVLPRYATFEDTGIIPLSANVKNTNFTVNYNITGGQVSEIKLDNQSSPLVILLQTTGDGNITIDLPRALIDSKLHDNMDDKFIVIEDGEEVEYNETHKTILDRTLSIPFQQGVKEIEIIRATLI